MNFMNSKKLLVTVICAAWACSCFGQNTSSSDQDIPPAVAKQLQAMQAKIDELEQELRNRPAQPQSAVPDGDGNAAHTLAEQNSGAPLPQVTAEKKQLNLTQTRSPNPFHSPISPGSTATPASRKRRSIPGSSRPKSGPTSIISTISSSRWTTPSAGRARSFGLNEFQLTQMGVGGDFH